MKKITAIIMASMMFAGTTANAAWEFDEKVLRDSGYGYVAYVNNDYITTYCHVISMGEDRDVNFIYYDFNGNIIAEPTDTESTSIYFTNNELSLISTTDHGTTLTDLDGNILAFGFEVGYWSDKDDVARVVKNKRGYGIMAYNGRMIIPMENEWATVEGCNIYTATNNNITDVYNYKGEKLFALDEDIRIDSVYDNWMVLCDRSKYKYALANLNGEYLTNFEYDSISIYRNNEEWQSGTFAELMIGNSRKYIDRNLSEINIFSENGVYCKGYKGYGDVVVINNNINYFDTMSALYNKRIGEYIIPFQDGARSSNSLFIIHSKDDNSYLSDLNGNYIKDLNEYVYAINEYEDGIAEVNGGSMFYDTKGNNIFPKQYKMGARIDNNEFVVVDDDWIKILTAKGIIGEALYTDVKIDINGVQIPCRSVYGYAGIIAEDLRNFGFDVIWDEEKRLLSITRNPDYYNITPMEYEADGTAGTHYADIYGSDINVEYNGKRISSYCIDGRTIIKPEDLAAEGITFNYDNSLRTLFMSIDDLERK